MRQQVLQSASCRCLLLHIWGCSAPGKLTTFPRTHLLSHSGCSGLQLSVSLLQYVCKEIALYPNSISVPLMENYGVRKQPKGMVHVTLHSITGLKSTDLLSKGDPYVVFEVGAAYLRSWVLLRQLELWW